MLKILKQNGWYIKDGVIADEKLHDIALIESRIKHLDLKKIGNISILEELLNKKLTEEVHYLVLQIHKVLNVGVPKQKIHTHNQRLLKIILTDGCITCKAIELSPINDLSLTTPPGVKLRLNLQKLVIRNKFLLLEPQSTEVLGGYVEELVKKWEVSKSLENAVNKMSINDRAEEWVPFESK